MAPPGNPAPLASIAERDAAFRDEAQRFALRFRCRDCSHVVASTVACSLGFPNAMLRDNAGAFDAVGQYAFCKYFEL